MDMDVSCPHVHVLCSISLLVAGSLMWLVCWSTDYCLFQSSVGRHRDNFEPQHAGKAYAALASPLDADTAQGGNKATSQGGNKPTADDNSQACYTLATALLVELCAPAI